MRKNKILAVLLCLTILIPTIYTPITADAYEKGVSFDTAIEKSATTKWTKAKISPTAHALYYKVKLPQRGFYEISLKTDSTDSVSLSVYDAKYNTVSSMSTMQIIDQAGTSGKIKYVYEKGTYYLKLTSPIDNLSISIKTKFESISGTDGMKNNTMESPVNLPINKKYVGSFSLTDNCDYYKIVMPANGNLNVQIKSNIAGDVNATLLNGKGVNLTSGKISYGSSGNESTEFTYNAAVKKGTYFLKLEINSLLLTGTYTVEPVVSIPITKISFKTSKATVRVGQSKKLAVNVIPKSATERYIFKSLNSKIVSINSSGTIKGKKAGKAKVKVISTYGELVGYCVVTVKK